MSKAEYETRENIKSLVSQNQTEAPKKEIRMSMKVLFASFFMLGLLPTGTNAKLGFLTEGTDEVTHSQNEACKEPECADVEMVTWFPPAGGCYDDDICRNFVMETAMDVFGTYTNDLFSQAPDGIRALSKERRLGSFCCGGEYLFCLFYSILPPC